MSPEELNNLILTNDERLEHMSKTYAKELKDIVPVIREFIKANLDKKGTLAIASLNLRMVQDLLQKAGMGQWGQIDKYLEKAGDLAVKEIQKNNPGMEDFLKPSPESLARALQDVKDETRLELANIERSTEQVVYQQLLSMEIIPTPMSTAVSVVRNRMKTNKHLAYTYLNTTMALQQRKIHRESGKTMEALGEAVLYLYAGPKDGLTRKFCRATVNKVFTDKQIAKLKNGQSLNVAQFGGGYNCRHRWLPTTRQYEKRHDSISKATSSTLKTINDSVKK